MNNNKKKKKNYKKPSITTEKLKDSNQIMIKTAYCSSNCAGAPASSGPC